MASAAWSLSAGICRMLSERAEVDDAATPTLQILDVRLQRQDAPECRPRFRLILSDGDAVIVALAGSPACEALLRDRIVEPGSVLRVMDFVTTDAKNGRPVIVILDCQVLAGRMSLIGCPRHDFGEIALMPPGAPAAAAGMHTPLRSPGGGLPSVKRPRVQGADSPEVSLSDLHGESYGGCTITVRVLRKSQLRQWRNERGEGCYFWLEVSDGSGPLPTRVTFFREAAQHWFAQLAEGRLYTFHGLTVKGPVARPQPGAREDCELIGDRSTRVEEAPDDGRLAPQYLQAVRICNIGAPGSMVDVVAVVSHRGPLDEVTLKQTGETRAKLELTLGDDTGDIALTLWGPEAAECTAAAGDVCVARQALVREYMGKLSLTAGRGSSVSFGMPSCPSPDALRVQQWWNSTQGVSPPPTVVAAAAAAAAAPPRPAPGGGRPTPVLCGAADVSDQCGGRGERLVLGMITTITGNLQYSACEHCKKTLYPDATGTGWCGKCMQQRSVRRRWLLRCQLTDHSGGTDVTVFDEAAEQLLQCSAESVAEADGTAQAAVRGLLHQPLRLIVSCRDRGGGLVSKDARPAAPGSGRRPGEEREVALANAAILSQAIAAYGLLPQPVMT
eukprot:TRINITY_DN60706_c0_g1_i1.p1 TRINITY_DN60706_c0_g1~~TRINITY_DN60706_c0_g1_i1.p1  ORF type:complete len:615 (+),score=137.77 TRINITY_DN60706_c0_g1_i1:87-1931(+)